MAASTGTGYPGEQLGLPPSGPGSVVGFGRRILALFVDWLIAYGLAGIAIPLGLVTAETLRFTWVGPMVIMAIWMVLGALSVRLFTFTPGQYALGLMVKSVDPRRPYVGLGRALIRVFLVSLVVPPLFADSDGRGLQDRLTATAVVRR